MGAPRFFKNKLCKDMRLHRTWRNMKTRCYNKKCKEYKNYGGRGITICDEWRNNFMNFYNWSMSSGYRKNLSIDRIDNDAGYYPDNCRWATVTMQNRNKRKGGFKYGEEHTYSKLTTEKVIHIRKKQLRNIEYAELYGISSSHVCTLIHNYTMWPHAIPEKK